MAGVSNASMRKSVLRDHGFCRVAVSSLETKVADVDFNCQEIEATLIGFHQGRGSDRFPGVVHNRLQFVAICSINKRCWSRLARHWSVSLQKRKLRPRL